MVWKRGVKCFPHRPGSAQGGRGGERRSGAIIILLSIIIGRVPPPGALQAKRV